MTTELEKLGDPFTAEFNIYDELLQPVNECYPARQGLGTEEFVAVLADEQTRSTDIESEIGPVRVPQLMNIGHIKWLNQDFYQKSFPEEFAAENVLYFNNILEIETSAAVQTGLQELAASEGVLVFDYPESSPQVLNSVVGLLGRLGITHSDVMELGSQAYYAGKVQLKRIAPRTDPLLLSEAYEGLGRSLDTVVDTSNLQGATLHRSLDSYTAARLNKFYEAAFTVLNNHPCKQGLSPEEFEEMIVEVNEVDKILYSDNGEAESLCLLGNDLGKFDWLNPAFYAKHFSDENKKGQILYFPAIATDPAKQGSNNSQDIINLIAELSEFGGNEAIIAFDCCDINQGFLDVFLKDMINKTPQANIEFTAVDSQRYCAIKLSSKS